MTDKSVEQLLSNLHSVQMATLALDDDSDTAVAALFEGAVEMILEHPDANNIIAHILLGMTQEVKEVSFQLHTLTQAIERADAFVLVVVGQLIALIDQNHIEVATSEQKDALKLSRWIVEMISADLNDEAIAERVSQMDELFNLYEEMGGNPDPNALRKIVNDE